MDKIKFKTQITGKDMGIFNIYVMYRKFSGIFSMLMGLVAFALAIYTIISGNITNGIIFIMIGCLFVFYFPWILIKRGKRQVNMNPTFNSPLHYTLDSNGVSIDQKSEHAKLKWEDCYKAVEISKAIYLFTSPKMAFIWPKDQIAQEYNDIKSVIKANMSPLKTKGLKKD